MNTANDYHQHFMCDLETLDVNSTAVVLSIALVPFSAVAKTIGPAVPLYLKLSATAVQEQIDAGRTVSASTLSFWFEQPDAPRAELFPSMQSNWPDAINTVVAYIENISTFADKRAVVWGNGAGFDCNILRSFIESHPAYNRKAPFYFFNDRDVRTMLDLSPESKNIPMPDGFVKHNALHDAMHEATMVCDALRRLNKPHDTPRIRPLDQLIGEYEVELRAIAGTELTSNESAAKQ